VARRLAKALAPCVDELAYAVEARRPRGAVPPSAEVALATEP